MFFFQKMLYIHIKKNVFVTKHNNHWLKDIVLSRDSNYLVIIPGKIWQGTFIALIITNYYNWNSKRKSHYGNYLLFIIFQLSWCIFFQCLPRIKLLCLFLHKSSCLYIINSLFIPLWHVDYLYCTIYAKLPHKWLLNSGRVIYRLIILLFYTEFILCIVLD